MTGVPVAPGVAVGSAVFHESWDVDIPVRFVPAGEVPAEQARLDQALDETKASLAETQQRIASEVGERDSRIFAVQGLLVDDPSFREALRERIRANGVNAEVAVRDEVAEWSERLANVAASTDRDPAADLRDVGRRIVRTLAGHEADEAAAPAAAAGRERIILVTKEFLPSDAVHVDRSRLAAIVTASGGVASHAAILARNLGIPAVTGVDVSRLPARGGSWVVDGSAGRVILEPGEEDVRDARKREQAYQAFRASLEEDSRGFAQTKGGASIELLVNVEAFEELQPAVLEGLPGVGLYRTEFLFMNRPYFPSEEEQYDTYRSVLEAVGDREVTFRTIDVGGDKPLPYLKVPPEPNPVLGWRGIRLSLEWPDMFYSQVRALLRASAHGNMRMLFPMITAIEELRRAREIVAEIQSDLKTHGVPFDENIAVGAMIEVPAAALATASMASEADFISIGTNDLAQYALAVDRNNARVADLYQPLHPGVLRLLRLIIEAAHAAETPVCLCGEMAGDPEATIVLLGLGLRSFSMSPYFLPIVRRVIGAVDLAESRKLAQKVFELESTTEIRALLRERTLELVPELSALFDHET